jgi:hypothetical protein
VSGPQLHLISFGFGKIEQRAALRSPFSFQARIKNADDKKAVNSAESIEYGQAMQFQIFRHIKCGSSNRINSVPIKS